MIMMTMLEKKDVDDYSITGCWTLTRDDVDDEYDTSNDGVGDDNNEDNDREDRKQAQVKRSTSGQYNGSRRPYQSIISSGLSLHVRI